MKFCCFEFEIELPRELYVQYVLLTQREIRKIFRKCPGMNEIKLTLIYHSFSFVYSMEEIQSSYIESGC